MWSVLVLLAASPGFCHHLVVDTPKGPVKGRSEGNYSSFFGVPYAMVDLDNPFGVSKPYPNFIEPFEAFDATIKCPQARFPEGTLQCLRLNIYVPQRRSSETVPVFVWFHGGGFVFGNAGYFGGKYLVQQDIIVVSVNFRLGPYGFLCLDDPGVPGNQGLKDQIDALKWVRENIHAFGGDPARVTIAGESSGGGSVDLHLYSDFEKYFDKAIVQSGAAEVEGFFVKPDHNAAVQLANILNCTAKNTKDALQFLAKVDPYTLVKAFNASDMILSACKEKKFKNILSFLTENPFSFYKPKKVKDTPVMIGYNSKEYFLYFVDEPEAFYETNNDIIFVDELGKTFNLKEEDLRRLADTVKKFYLGGKPVKKENMLELVDFMSDYMGAYAVENSVNRLVEQGAHVYKYMFSYTGNSPYRNVTGVGAFHTEELQYLFEFEEEELIDPEYIMMRDRMTALWANFVKIGNPTPETSPLIPVAWATVPRETRPYMNIDLEMCMMQDVYHHRIAFWDLLWNAYRRNSKIFQ